MAQPNVSPQNQLPSGQSPQGLGCLLRFHWMVLGYLVALLCGVSIVNHHGDFSFVDVIYWLALLSVPLARWWDIRHCNGTRADGQPATMRDWTVQTVLTGIGGAVGWVLIHLVRLRGWW